MNNREETEIQNRIRLECSDIAVLFRINVYEGQTASGRYIKTAIKGYPDLSGYRKSDGKAIFLEIKAEKNGVIRPEQENFIRVALENHCLAGFARSVEDARKIINGK